MVGKSAQFKVRKGALHEVQASHGGRAGRAGGGVGGGGGAQEQEREVSAPAPAKGVTQVAQPREGDKARGGGQHLEPPRKSRLADEVVERQRLTYVTCSEGGGGEGVGGGGDGLGGQRLDEFGSSRVEPKRRYLRRSICGQPVY